MRCVCEGESVPLSFKTQKKQCVRCDQWVLVVCVFTALDCLLKENQQEGSKSEFREGEWRG